MEASEDEQLEGVDSLPEPELVSTSSGLSSILNTELTEDSRSSSGDNSFTSSSSGDILAILVPEAVAPMLLDPSPSREDSTVMAEARQKCVGRNNKGVSWGSTSVIGRRREMEDAVAVVPGFMSRTCNHVGGCTAPGSRTSGEISPVHFFGVFDGHGGSQVPYIFFLNWNYFWKNFYIYFFNYGILMEQILRENGIFR
jgi:protein phosphatase 2C